MTDTNKTAKQKVDYSAMEADWRAGILSPRQIAAKYTEATGIAVSHAAVIKHFTKKNVERDLAGKIRAKAQAMVTQAAVTETVTPEKAVTENAIIEANATLQANALLDHRRDIKRHRTLAMKLLDEIEAITDSPDMFEKLGELMIDPIDDGTPAGKQRAAKLRDMFDRVLSCPGRVDSMKKLSETLKNLIALERQALGLDDVDPEAGKAGKLTDEQVTARLSELLNKARSSQ